jgi:hypothetical protein
VTLLSAIPKRFELLVYRGMYIVQRLEESNVYQSTWLPEEPIDDNEPIEYASFVLNSIENGNQVDSISASSVRHQLLLNEMSVGSISQDSCGWDLICWRESRK